MADDRKKETSSAIGQSPPQPPSSTTSPSTRRRGDAALAVAVALATFVLLLATLGQYGMAWDEGANIDREERLHEWFARVAGRSPVASRAWAPVNSELDRREDYLREAGASARSPWSRASLRFYWQFAREPPHFHPPFFALLELVGSVLTRGVLPPLESYRFGPVALFSATVGAIYALNARRYGRSAGFAAALGLLAMPRVFAHAHLASFDGPLLCLWVLSALAFLKAGVSGRAGWAWTAAFGLAFGCAASTKLTGWFVPIPLAAWALLYRDLRAFRALICGGLLACVVIVALNPSWWSDPVASARIYLTANLTRASSTEIPSYFFGKVYMFGLPWYNTLAITALVVPIGTLALAVVGIGRVVAGRFRDREGALYLICWAFLMALRALPMAPGHDVERQFLPAFAFLACLLAPGVAALGAWAGRLAGPSASRLAAPGVAALVLAASAWSTWLYHPLQLSYYNAFIGGLSGAARAGLEPTYYWEALTPDVRDWINAHTAPGRTVVTGVSIPMFEYLHHWGLLRPSPLPSAVADPQWYIVLNRAGHLHYYRDSIASFLMEHGRPTFVKRLGVAPDVPLVAIYPLSEVVRAPASRPRRGRP